MQEKTDYTKQIGFWKRLESFVKDVQVNCAAGQEEKEMLLSISQKKIDEFRELKNQESVFNEVRKTLQENEFKDVSVNTTIVADTAFNFRTEYLTIEAKRYLRMK